MLENGKHLSNHVALPLEFWQSVAKISERSGMDKEEVVTCAIKFYEMVFSHWEEGFVFLMAHSDNVKSVNFSSWRKDGS